MNSGNSSKLNSVEIKKEIGPENFVRKLLGSIGRNTKFPF